MGTGHHPQVPSGAHRAGPGQRRHAQRGLRTLRRCGLPRGGRGSPPNAVASRTSSLRTARGSQRGAVRSETPPRPPASSPGSRRTRRESARRRLRPGWPPRPPGGTAHVARRTSHAEEHPTAADPAAPAPARVERVPGQREPLTNRGQPCRTPPSHRGRMTRTSVLHRWNRLRREHERRNPADAGRPRAPWGGERPSPPSCAGDKGGRVATEGRASPRSQVCPSEVVHRYSCHHAPCARVSRETRGPAGETVAP